MCPGCSYPNLYSNSLYKLGKLFPGHTVYSPLWFIVMSTLRSRRSWPRVAGSDTAGRVAGRELCCWLFPWVEVILARGIIGMAVVFFCADGFIPLTFSVWPTIFERTTSMMSHGVSLFWLTNWDQKSRGSSVAPLVTCRVALGKSPLQLCVLGCDWKSRCVFPKGCGGTEPLCRVELDHESSATTVNVKIWLEMHGWDGEEVS